MYNGISVLIDNLLRLKDSTVNIIDSNTQIFVHMIALHDMVTKLIYIQPSHDYLALQRIERIEISAFMHHQSLL